MNDSVSRVGALVAPRNVAIVGASDKPGSWSKRVYRSLTRNGFEGSIYPVNPKGEPVWGGVACFRDLSSLPEPPDHVVVLVPGLVAVETVRKAAKAGARSATVFSSGFGEGGDEEGRRLGEALRCAVVQSGMAVSGPNCLGSLVARSKFMTLTDERITIGDAGPVAIFGASGGVVTAMYRALHSRGIVPGYALTVGNEVGLNSADYIRFFAQDADTTIICCFVEAVKDADAFRAACLEAYLAGKPIVMIKIGGSEASRAAALAHTGALAGSLECFDAATASLGVIRVETIDDLVEVVEVFTHGTPPLGPRVGAITFSGGLKGLLLEGAERAGLSLPTLRHETLATLSDIVGVGTSLGNPLDAGFTALSSSEAYLRCVKAMLNDPGIDMLLVQEELPLEEGLNAKAGNLKQIDTIATEAGKPIGVVSMATYMYSDYTRAFRNGFPNLPVLHESGKALKAIGAAGRWATMRRALERPVPHGPLHALDVAEVTAIAGPMRDGLRVLGEAASKALVARFGIRAAREAFARTAEEAVTCAEATGYPVVLKLVSPDVQHKTEVGGVVLGLADAESVAAAFARIRANLAGLRPDAAFQGVLVAEQVSGGVELVLGVQRDPEVGPVVMFGTGGVLLELHSDVAFGPVPLDAAQAEALIARTAASRLIDGYRGVPPCDRAAVGAALVGLSHLAAALGDTVESIDLNPVIAMPGKPGIVVLDALVVLNDRVAWP